MRGRWAQKRLSASAPCISRGHRVGASGVRIPAMSLLELRRRDARFARAMMCIGGGRGLAAIFEGVDA